MFDWIFNRNNDALQVLAAFNGVNIGQVLDDKIQKLANKAWRKDICMKGFTISHFSEIVLIVSASVVELRCLNQRRSVEHLLLSNELSPKQIRKLIRTIIKASKWIDYELKKAENAKLQALKVLYEEGLLDSVEKDKK